MENITSMTEGDMQHAIDCAYDCDVAGNEYGRSLVAEDKRRSRKKVIDSEIANACVAALGDRGAQPIDDPGADSARMLA